MSPSPQLKKVLIIVDMAVNGLWLFLWFVAFCFIADQLRKTVYGNNTLVAVQTCMGATVAFSLFSVILWVRTCVKLYMNHYTSARHVKII